MASHLADGDNVHSTGQHVGAKGVTKGFEAAIAFDLGALHDAPHHLREVVVATGTRFAHGVVDAADVVTGEFWEHVIHFRPDGLIFFARGLLLE